MSDLTVPYEAPRIHPSIPNADAMEGTFTPSSVDELPLPELLRDDPDGRRKLNILIAESKRDDIFEDYARLDRGRLAGAFQVVHGLSPEQAELAEHMALHQDEIRKSIDTLGHMDPDTIALVDRNTKLHGLPPSLAADKRVAVIEQAVKAAQIATETYHKYDYETGKWGLKARYPVLRRLLANPSTAGQIRDDVEAMADLEYLVWKRANDNRNWLSAYLTEAVRGAWYGATEQVGGAMAGLALYAPEGKVTLPDPAGLPVTLDASVIGKMGEALMAVGDPVSRALAHRIASGSLGSSATWGAAAGNQAITWGLSLVGRALGGAAASELGPAGMAIGQHIGGALPLIGMEAKFWLDEAETYGLDQDIAEKYARLYGVGSGLIEHAQYALIAGRVGKGARLTARSVQKRLALTVLKIMAGDAITEGLEEVSQGSLSRFFLAKAIKEQRVRNPEFKGKAPGLLEGAGREFLVAAGMSFTFTGGGITAIRSVRNSNKLAMRAAEQSEEFWGKIVALAKAIKLTERNPLLAEATVDETLTEHGLSDTVYVPLEKVQEFFQGDTRAMQEALEKLGVADQVEDAEKGADLEISAGKFATQFGGSPLDQFLQGSVKFNAGGMTVAEMKGLHDEAEKKLAEAADEIAALKDEGLPPQLETMYNQLTAPVGEGGRGFNAGAVDAQMAVVYSMIGVMADRHGQTIKEFLTDYSIVLDPQAKGVRAVIQPLFQGGLPADEDVQTGQSVTLEVFHGTNAEFDEFDVAKQSEGTAGTGFYFTPSKERAKVFGKIREDGSPRLKKARVTLSNPWVVEDYNDLPVTGTSQERLREQGYDGIVVKRKGSVAEGEVIAFDKDQIEVIGPDEFYQADTDSPLRGAVTLADAGAVISLFADADLSTVLHEMCHISLRDMENLEASGQASEQISADLATFRKFVGGKLDRDGHEKISTAFEQYLLEGKAPSLPLVKAFRRIHTFMTRIYRALNGTGVPISEEVREVFDRMVASQQDIEEAHAYYQSREDFVKALPGDADALAVLHRAAREEAVEAQTQIALRAYLATKGMRDSLKALAKREVESLPQYNAIRDLVDHGGLNADEIAAEWGEEMLAGLKETHPRLVTKKGQISMMEAALNLGYETEESLMNDLLNTDKPAEAIQKRYAELIANREAMFRKDAEQMETVPGEEAYHNNARADYLLAEATRVAEQIAEAKGVSPRRYTKKMYSDAVKAYLSELPIGQAIQYDKWANAERKHTRAFEKAVKKEDWEQAEYHKNRQLFAHFMVQQSIRIRQMRDQKIRSMNRVARSKGKTLTSDHRKLLKQVLSRFGLLSAPKNFPASRFDEMMKDMEELGGGAPLPSILTEAGQRPINTLSVREFTQLADAFSMLVARGRNSVKFDNNAKSASVAEYSSKCVAGMSGRKTREKLQRGHTRFYAAKELVRSVLAEVSPLIYDFKVADGHKNLVAGQYDKGPIEQMHEALFQADKSANEALTLFAEAHMDEVEADIKAYGDRMRAKYGTKPFAVPGVPLPAVLQKAGYHGWTAEMILVFALNMGNESNKDKLLRGFQMTPMQADLLCSQLQKSDLALVQHIWDALDSLFDGANETHRRVDGVSMVRVERSELTVRPADAEDKNDTVTLAGGYFPVKYDPSASSKMDNYDEKSLIEQERRSSHLLTRTVSSFTKERTEAAYPLALSLRTMHTHISDTIRYTYLTEPVLNVYRVVRTDEFRDAYIDLMGKERYDLIVPWLGHINRPELQVSGTVDRMGIKAQRLAVIAALGMRFKTSVKQTLSLTTTARKLGKRQTAKWVAKFSAHPRKRFDQVNALSTFMRDRSKSIQAEMLKVFRHADPFRKSFHIAGREITRQDLQEFSMWPIRLGDTMGAYPTWLAAFDKEMQKHGDEAKAVNFADSVVAETQPISTAMFQNAWQTGGKDKSASGKLIRWVTAPFVGWTMLRYGGITRAMYTGWREGNITTGDFVNHVILEHLIPPVAAASLATMMADDDDDETWAEKTLWETLGYWLSWIPVVRDAPSAFRYGLGTAAMELPQSEPAKMAYKGMAKTVRGEIGGATMAFGELAQWWYGVPAIRATKEAYALSAKLVDTMTDGEEDSEE